MQRVGSFSNQSLLYHHPLWIPAPLPWCSLSISQAACISLSTPPIGVRAELDNKLFELMLIFSHPQRLRSMGGRLTGYIGPGDSRDWVTNGNVTGCRLWAKEINLLEMTASMSWRKTRDLMWHGPEEAGGGRRAYSRRVVSWMWDASLRNGHEIEIWHRAQLFARWKGSLLRYCCRKNFICA